MAICNNCGEWTEPSILERGGTASMVSVCPHCLHREPFVQYPLWWIAGSPGSGKSTLAPLLRRILTDFVVFEGEAIDFWRFDGEPGDYSSLYNQWLKVAHEIAINNRPVVFLATATPEQLDACTLRSRFSVIHYIGLVCSPEEQERRLRARPAWRASNAPEFIRDACDFTEHLRDCARKPAPSVTLCDTTNAAPATTAERIARWVRAAQ